MKSTRFLTAALLTALSLPTLAEDPERALLGVDGAEGPGAVTLRAGGPGQIKVIIDGEEVDMIDLNGEAVPFEIDFDAPQVFDQAVPAIPLVDATYLGVSAQAIDQKTAKKLGLEHAAGLSLSFVAPDSPAAKAGLKAGDVLLKLSDQHLINPEQLAALIRMQEAGEKVALQVHREGETIELTAELGQAKVPQIGPGGARLDQPRWRVQRNGVRDNMAIPLERLMVPEGLEGPGMQVIPRAKAGNFEDIEQMIRDMMDRQADQIDRMRQLRQRLDLDLDGIRGELKGGAAMKSRVVFNDGTHTITLSTDAGGRQLTVKDKGGNILYEGRVPEDNAEQHLIEEAGLPQEIIDKVKPLLDRNSNRFEFKLEGLPVPEAAPKEEPAPEVA
ncbi:MAG: PDZ domain-containing protein [Planctomycetota bacterium]